MPDSVLTQSGRILLARLLHGDRLAGLTHCALGDGDGTFVDPAHPPAPSITQTALRHERCRKAADRLSYLLEDSTGPVLVDGLHYRESATETPILGAFFRFTGMEATGFAIREVGFFGGMVAFVAGVTGAYAVDGLYDAALNATGQVLNPGYLYEVRHLPDVHKTVDTVMEIIAITRL